MSNHDNFEVNFSLKGNASIQVGVYILLAAYIFKTLLDGFLIDDNPAGMLSVELIESIIFLVSFITIILSGFALYFKGRRKAKKFSYKFWNAKTKKRFWFVLVSFIILFLILNLLLTLGYVDYIIPTFLFFYSFLIFFNKNNFRKSILKISILAVLFAILCLVIPSYWYYSLFILGIVHVTYGFSVR